MHACKYTYRDLYIMATMVVAIYFYSVCDILSTADGLIIPKLTQLSYETVTYDARNFLTVVAQSALVNVAPSDAIMIWRNTASELLNVIRSLLARICPAVVILVESTEDIAVSLSSVLQNRLVLLDSATVDVMIVQYDSSDNVTNVVNDAMISAGAMINTSDINAATCSIGRSQSGITLILNSPTNDADTILNMVSEEYL